MSDRSDFAYTAYIEATAEKVWEALTDPEMTAAYWGHSNVSDWQPGSSWEHRRTDGSGIADVVGTVVEAERREAAGGWSAVLSNLKTYLETGKPLPLPMWGGSGERS